MADALLDAAGEGATSMLAARDEYRQTPLHFAARKGHEALCRQLLRRGADPGAADRFGDTPVDVADEKGVQRVLEGERRGAGNGGGDGAQNSPSGCFAPLLGGAGGGGGGPLSSSSSTSSPALLLHLLTFLTGQEAGALASSCTALARVVACEWRAVAGFGGGVVVGAAGGPVVAGAGASAAAAAAAASGAVGWGAALAVLHPRAGGGMQGGRGGSARRRIGQA
jgi:hypothetical protein